MENLASALPIIAVSILVPLFMYKFFFPWLAKGGKGSNKAALIIILLNLALYGYWIYRVINEITQPQTILLVSIPVLAVVVTELILLLISRYHFLHKLSVYFTITTFPLWTVFILFDKNYGPDENSEFAIFLLVFGSFLIHCLLYFPVFALYKKINPNVPSSYDLKLGFLDKYLNAKDFDKTEEYKQIKRAGIQAVTFPQFLLVLLKYGFIILLFWLYVYIIAH
jgi:hypothetical protein